MFSAVVAVAAAAAFTVSFLLFQSIYSLFLSPLARVPGPKLFALTRWRLAYEDYKGIRSSTVNELHKLYGPVVRVGPNEVSFNSLSALRTIYGAGSGFEKTLYYDFFDVYGRKNMFTFHSAKEHSERKKLVAQAFTKSAILKGNNAAIVESKVREYLRLLDRENPVIETFSTLHYFAMDSVGEFLYGKFGKSACLEGIQSDRDILSDVLDPVRRKFTWFAMHLPKFTAWLYSRTGLAGSIAWIVQLPTAFTGARNHSLEAALAFCNASTTAKAEDSSVIAKLWRHNQKANGLDDLDIASECADHFLAGLDTASETTMFLIWALSRPEQRKFQERLIDEVQGISEEYLNGDGIPRAEVADKLRYLNAVIKETMRLYTPLGGPQPRLHPAATMIDGYMIPPKSVVFMSPYVMHRNPDVFKDPLKFNPERWLDEDTAQMDKWFWAFSSGGRMCIGLQ